MTEKFLLRQGLPCRDRVLRPGARPGLGPRDRHVRAVGMRVRQHNVLAQQSFLALCRDRDLRVATLFRGMLSGLGRDKGLLCHDRDFSALCRDRVWRWARFGSRQGFPYVATEFSQWWDIRDKNSKGGVAIGCFFVATQRASQRK